MISSHAVSVCHSFPAGSTLYPLVIAVTVYLKDKHSNTMGGDGGVIASNRRYMRGAGTADTVGDVSKHGAGKDPALVAEELTRIMTTCALTGQPLKFEEETIVACPYGKLYKKEAAVEALLRRKTHDTDELGDHIKGLKDLHEARFSTTKGKDGTVVPICPVTEKELNGHIPAYLVLPGNPDEVNVVSERVLTEMKDLIEEYGPIERKIRLAPPEAVLEEVKRELDERRSKKKSDKKRKHDGSKGAALPSKKPSSKLVVNARAKVSAAVKTNEILSSLFTTEKT